MNLLGIDLIIWAGIAGVSIILLMIIWKIARWKGEFDRWRREINEWRNDTMTMSWGSQDSSDTVERSSFEEHEERERTIRRGSICSSEDRDGTAVCTD